MKLTLPVGLAALSVLPLLSLGACAALGGGSKTYEVEAHELAYDAGGVPLTGYLARPIDAAGARPGVIVVHEWWGHNDYVRQRAEQLAALGYVAFALDMYGDGKTAAHPTDAGAFMQEVMGNAAVMEARFRAALAVLRRVDGVDPAKTAAIGYCMGGGIVLRMARTTAELDCVASFHGSLGAALGLADAGHVQRVLLANGAADPFVPKETVDALSKELMAMPGVRQVAVFNYPGVTHGFTNPAATQKGEEFGLPLRYDADADKASWAELEKLLRATFE